jgi:hypothetical protein
VTDSQYEARAKERLTKRRDATPTGCWLYTGTLISNGYGNMSFRGKAEYTHRIAALLYLDFDLGSGLCVLHKCDTPACFNPDHLMIGTQQENMRDAARRGRMGGYRLTAEQVGEIKYLLHEGSSYRSLGTRYGVSTTAVGQIARGETWKNVAATAPQKEEAPRDSTSKVERP